MDVAEGTTELKEHGSHDIALLVQVRVHHSLADREWHPPLSPSPGRQTVGRQGHEVLVDAIQEPRVK